MKVLLLLSGAAATIGLCRTRLSAPSATLDPSDLHSYDLICCVDYAIFRHVRQRRRRVAHKDDNYEVAEPSDEQESGFADFRSPKRQRHTRARIHPYADGQQPRRSRTAVDTKLLRPIGRGAPSAPPFY